MLSIGDVIRMGNADDAASVSAAAQALGPWRKGPFEVCGVRIDGHWDCAPKWHRIQGIVDLSGKTVCDVGCNNGYYLYRMAAAGASSILGIDPVEQFEKQYAWLSRFAPAPRAVFERKGFEDLSGQFDVIFCLGLLYHVHNPHELFETLRRCLSRGGTLIVESITADLGETVLVPAGKYAGASGIHWLPGSGAVLNWLRRSGFQNTQIVSTTEAAGEQRRTPYADLAPMSESITDGRTKEGYPAPLRTVFAARR